ncbi:MAG TPA: DUF1616 domain-containing protein [Chloroflexota bacterium]|nr:DUF1616 domain-containing protein [Chloroflexota bacterium]
MAISERTTTPAPTVQTSVPAEADSPTTARGRHGWWDLASCAVIAVLALLVAGASPALRTPIGLAAVLYVPGFALAAAIFPTNAQIDRVERVALSLGSSLGLLAVLALILDKVDHGLAPESIRSAVVGSSLLLLVLAIVRRARTAPAAPRTVTPPNRARPSRAKRFTQAIVVANLLVAGLAYVLTLTTQPAAPTEFYVVGPQRVVLDYPRDVQVGEPAEVIVGIHQTTDAGGTYHVEAATADTVLASVGPVTLKPGERWEAPMRIALPAPGDDQEVVIRLLREGQPDPYRYLRLWLNVHASEPA